MRTNKRVRNYIDEMLENDEYSPEEAAFMIGYLSEES